MDLFKIIGIAIITLLLTIIIKEFKPEFSIYVTLSGSIIILFLIINNISYIISEFNNILVSLNIDSKIFTMITKIIVIGYITEFSASICKDFNNNVLSEKIILAGKILIFSISLPIFKSIVDIVIGLL